jgi:6-phosphogluconolactonase
LPDVIIMPDPAALAREAAQCFAKLVQEAIGSRGRFSVALSGGSTPGRLYRLLAEEPYRTLVPWDRVHLFWGDERCVPLDDPESNYHLAAETLLSQVPIPPENIHRMPGELEPSVAARAYDRILQDFFCGPRPRFDLVLLGLGEDGHTASLFPDSPLLTEADRLVAPAEALYQGRPAQRITLTLPAINSARHVWFLVNGSAKAAVVRAVLDGPARQLPAQWIQPAAGQLTWLLDAAAARALGG